eukprot:6273974-Amphidinium_carterae.1
MAIPWPHVTAQSRYQVSLTSELKTECSEHPDVHNVEEPHQDAPSPMQEAAEVEEGANVQDAMPEEEPYSQPLQHPSAAMPFANPMAMTGALLRGPSCLSCRHSDTRRT